MPGGGSSAEGKARYRARAKGEGIFGIIRRLRHKAWEDVRDNAVHQCDFAFHLTDLRITGQRTIIASIIAPIEYMPELTKLHLETEHSFGYVRAYTVPRSALLVPDPNVDLDYEAD